MGNSRNIRFSYRRKKEPKNELQNMKNKNLFKNMTLLIIVIEFDTI